MNQDRKSSMLRAAWMNGFLIAVNVLVFAAGMAGTGRIWDAAFMIRSGALYAPLLLKGQDFYRLVTAMFFPLQLSRWHGCPCQQQQEPFFSSCQQRRH